MKFFFTCVTVLAALTSFAQTPPDPVFWPTDSATGRVQFQQVVQVDSSLTAAAIIQRARQWVATTYTNANRVIQQDDPAGGMLVAKGVVIVPKVTIIKLMGTHTSNAQMPINHTLTIEAKPGRYRVTLSDLTQTESRMPINPRYSSTSGEEFETEVRKSYADIGMKGMGVRAAKKDQTNNMTNERTYATAIISRCTALLESLKQAIQKKGEKDW